MTQHLTHTGLPDGMTRWQFFGLIERGRRQLGLSKGAIAYLKVAISNTMDEDFVAGRICSFWTSVTKIAAQAGLDRRQIARIEGDLIKRGLLAKSASDHSRRSGCRKYEKIGNEFGINLAPLIAQAAEVQAAARKAAFEEQEAERLRIRIKKLFGDIRRLCLDGAMEAAEEILPNRRPSTIQSFERQRQVAEALEAVWEDFSAQIGRGEKSHQCDIPPALNTSEETINKTCRAKEKQVGRPVRTSPAHAALLASESLREIIELYWNVLDNRGPLSWRTIHSRRADIERQIVEVGAELSEIAGERDATRLALEEFVDLRNRIGVELVEHRGRVIFVVPDGSELLAWRAPGLSEIASYNGRMYRLSQ